MLPQIEAFPMTALYKLLLLRPLDAAPLAPLDPGLRHAGVGALRIAMLLFVLAMLNLVDLAYTLFAHHIGWLNEMNPVADAFLSQGLEPSLICYKLLMVIAGSTMLWRLRGSSWAAPACWLLVAANVGMSVLWYLWSREMIFTYETRLAMGI
jgi:hypothetical protein